MNRTEGEKDFVQRQELWNEKTGEYTVIFHLHYLDVDDPEVHLLLHKIQKDLNAIYTEKLAKLFGLGPYFKT